MSSSLLYSTAKHDNILSYKYIYRYLSHDEPLSFHHQFSNPLRIKQEIWAVLIEMKVPDPFLSRSGEIVITENIAQEIVCKNWFQAPAWVTVYRQL